MCAGMWFCILVCTLGTCNTVMKWETTVVVTAVIVGVNLLSGVIKGVLGSLRV